MMVTMEVADGIFLDSADFCRRYVSARDLSGLSVGMLQHSITDAKTGIMLESIFSKRLCHAAFRRAGANGNVLQWGKAAFNCRSGLFRT